MNLTSTKAGGKTMEVQAFIRCHQCRKLKGCDMGIDGVLSCSERDCSEQQKHDCKIKMRVLIDNGEDGQFAAKCAICSYKFRMRHSFASDE